MGRASLVSLLLAAGIAALTACAPAVRPSAERGAANPAADREALDDQRG